MQRLALGNYKSNKIHLVLLGESEILDLDGNKIGNF